MPSLIEFLLAPWKILGVIFSTHADQAVQSKAALAANAAAGLNDSICSFQDLGGGQLVSVCHAFGYEMPSFIFWASFLILLLFTAACVSLTRQCTEVARALNRVAIHVGKLPESAFSKEGLDTVRAVMSKEELVALPWKQFEETLLISSENEDIYSTQPIDSFFSKAALIEENVHSQLFGTIPGILTGLGLLMTFIAILDGLSHVSVSANMDVTGIGGLINGLSGKFVSSIVSVMCAVSFVLVERFAYAKPVEPYRRLVAALAAKFKRKTTEHMLNYIQNQLMTQAVMQREFAQVLSKIQNSSASGRGRGT